MRLRGIFTSNTVTRELCILYLADIARLMGDWIQMLASDPTAGAVWMKIGRIKCHFTVYLLLPFYLGRIYLYVLYL